MKNIVKRFIAAVVCVSLFLSCNNMVFAEMADEISADLEQIWSETEELSEEEEAAEEENNGATTYLPPEEQKILDEINNNSINMYDMSETQDSSVQNQPMEANGELSAQTAAASVTGNIEDEFKVEPVGDLYNVVNNNNDYVSMATGALTVERNLLSIPGANGLDLNLSIRYNSDDAIITSNEFEKTEDSISPLNANNFAIGWSFGFPTIINTKVKWSYGWNKETSFRFADGSEYKLVYKKKDKTTNETIYELKNYKLSDVSVRKSDDGDYTVSYLDGTVQTFDSEYGNIKQTKDRFGNEINFYYENIEYNKGSFFDYIFNPSYYRVKFNALTKIVDSGGRVIDIEYDINSNGLGREIRNIYIKSGGITYATLVLKTMNSYYGAVITLSEIKDGENLSTKYNYDEKVGNIYGSDWPNNSYFYNVHNIVVALNEIVLPTGGSVNYEYEKARRAYRWTSYYTYTDWYEIYKLSKVSDSTGYERTYEYQNDRSGYPTSYLDSDLNVENKGFTYSCIVKEKNKAVMTVFDYQHNKISEQTYDKTNVQNDFIINNGDKGKSVIIGDYIYYIDYMSPDNGVTKYRQYMYKQNLNNGNLYILTPPNKNINAEIKTHGNNIYLFEKFDSMCRVSMYDTLLDEWSDAGIYEISGTTDDSIYYINSKFYMLYKNNSKLYFLCYDPSKDIESRWTKKETAFDYSGYVTNLDEKLYFYKDNKIIEYNFLTNTVIEKTYDILNNKSILSGFNLNSKTYFMTSDGIYEFEQAAGKINSYLFKNSEELMPYLSENGEMLTETAFRLQKGANGKMYVFTNINDHKNEEKIYIFDRGFSYAGKRIAQSQIGEIKSYGTSSAPVFIVDGCETIKMYNPKKTQSTVHTEYRYNDLNQVTSVMSANVNGIETKNLTTENYEYIDGTNVITSYTDILGNKTEYEYDSTYYIPTKITEYAGTGNALVTTNILDSSKTKIIRMDKTYDDVNLRTEYTYDDSNKPGNVTKETFYEKPSGLSVYMVVLSNDYEYDPTNTLVAKTSASVLTNGSDFTKNDTQVITTSYKYDDIGKLYTIKDPMGYSTSYTYHKNGLPYYKFPGGHNDVLQYNWYIINGNNNYYYTAYNDKYIIRNYLDNMGRVISVEEDDIYLHTSTMVRYEYNGRNISKVIDALDNYTNYGYDIFDRVINIKSYTRKEYSGGYGTECSQEINIAYDDFNRTRTVDNGGIKTKTYYDIAGRVIKEESYTDAGTAITTTEYDYMGNVISTTSPKNEKTEYTYDDRGLLKSIKYPSNDVILYTYDSQGNVLKVTNNGVVTQTNTYDAAGRLLTSTDAMGYTEKFVYDKNGRVMKALDKNGEIAEYTYYGNNVDKLLEYSKGEKHVSYNYDNFNNLTYQETPEGRYNYEYTYNNLLESIETPDGETINYEYDANHNVSKVIDYSGDEITYRYNILNKISEVKRNGTVAAQYEYYQNGALESITYPGQGKSEFEYDGALRLTEQVNSLADGTVTNTYEYTYDLNGNQIKKIDNRNTTSYTYDNMNRLKSVTEPDGTKEVYTFDGQGNIQTKTMTHPEGYEYAFKQNGKEYTLDNIATREITYSYDANNRLKFEGEYIGGSGEEYEGFLEITRYSEYDNNGNMLKRTRGGQVDEETESFEYNELNQLTKYTDVDGNSTTYKYNPDGMRTSKINNGVETKYYWDRGYISAESVNDEYTASNYIGATGIFARDESENTDYMLKNGHGDVTSLVSEGTESKDYDYSAYGVEKNKEEGDSNPFRYSGEYVDEESGLIYLRNRYYDPSIGRFINEDPAKDGINWYVYCGSNPIKFVDPSGLSFSLENQEKYNSFLSYLGTLSDGGYNIIGDEDAYIIDEIIFYGNVVSDVGTALLSWAAGSDINIEILFNSGFGGSYTRTGKNNALISVGGTSFLSKEAQSVFIHELTHMYTDVKGYDAIFRNSVKTNSYNARTYALTAYREAAAITVEEQYRRDIGHTSRSEVFNNLGLEPDMIGVNDYGAWPEMIVAPGSEYYGQIQFSNSVTLMQSKLIVQDIIWRSKTK